MSQSFFSRTRAFALGSAAIAALAVVALIGGHKAPVVAAPQTVTAVFPPQRIVSTNLCADQLVAVLADPGQIAGLGRYARDPNMSAAADVAQHLPVFGGAAEQLIAARPDLVVGMPASTAPGLAGLEPGSYRTLDVAFVTDYAGIVSAVRQVARAVGHPARGEALIAAMDADLARLPHASRPAVAAYYQRRGFLTGSGTLVDDVIRRAGVENLATRLNKPALSQMSLEEMAAAQPDFLIVESATDQVRDQGVAMLHHPALDGIPRIRMPEAWTVCGGPAYVKAVRAVAEVVS